LKTPKPWEFFSLSDVTYQVTKLIEQPEQGYVFDAGEYCLICFVHFMEPFMSLTEMGSLYETNLTEYIQKMKEMLARHGIPRPESSTNTGMNCTLKRISTS